MLVILLKLKIQGLLMVRLLLVSKVFMALNLLNVTLSI